MEVQRNYDKYSFLHIYKINLKLIKINTDGGKFTASVTLKKLSNQTQTKIRYIRMCCKLFM